MTVLELLLIYTVVTEITVWSSASSKHLRGVEHVVIDSSDIQNIINVMQLKKATVNKPTEAIINWDLTFLPCLQAVGLCSTEH